MRKQLTWFLLALAVLVPIGLAANSPFLQWRGPVYIFAGFSGIVGLCLLLVQPLLATNLIPGLSPIQSRKIHRLSGLLLVLAVMAHVIGLWFTSPPDVIDVLLFRSPTPFSIWGVVAMWAVFAAALFATFRQRSRISPRMWRYTHLSLAAVIMVGTIVHALLIEGAMETYSKIALCALVAVTFLWTVISKNSFR